jgi:hypothetical protein
MTTIYETYLERVKSLEDEFYSASVFCGCHEGDLYNAFPEALKDLKNHLRQSFIAMVGGMIKEKRRILEEGAHCEVFDYVQSEVSRLESELIRLREEK